jgi:ribosomal protein S27AE
MASIKRVEDLLALVGSWEGFDVAAVTTEEELEPDVHGVPAPRLVIELRANATAEKRCSRCGELVVEIHDTTPRRIRDLPMGEWDTWLILPRARLRCPRCGPTVEAIPWLDRYQRMTKRLADRIAQLAQVTSLQATAAWFRVSWDTVKQIDHRALTARLGPIDAHWDGLRVLVIDEFALHRGHRLPRSWSIRRVSACSGSPAGVTTMRSPDSSRSSGRSGVPASKPSRSTCGRRTPPPCARIVPGPPSSTISSTSSQSMAAR